MDSVAIDFFDLPEVTHQGKIYNRVALCVDRESGWMIATPHEIKGFTAQVMAQHMYAQWDMFGIPSVVSSDRGSHFTSAWWQTMCALFGVTVAYGQAYHHQANGRAENAGQQLMKKLKKLIADRAVPEVSWVDLLPRALRAIHDAPGESGFSPYELVFGRHRPLANLPYTPEREAEEAKEFFQNWKICAREQPKS
jgi:transposase InsO family protein